MLLQVNAGQLTGRDRAAPSRKPDSGHVGTVSTTARVRQTSRNAMKPRIQCVLAHWKSGFRASGSGPIFMVKLGGMCSRCMAGTFMQ